MCLLVMSFDRQEHPNWGMVGSADHERDSALGQRCKQAVGVGEGSSVANHGRDVVQWHLAQFLALRAGLLDQQETTVTREMPTFVRDFHDPAAHRP